MKKSITLILFVLFSTVIAAQEKAGTYIISFKDKDQSIYSLSNPNMYLSQRSIERRLFQQIPLNETDLPINPAFLQQVRETGADVFYHSKWLNVAIARLADEAQLTQIKSLPFVKSVEVTEATEIKRSIIPFKWITKPEKLEKAETSQKIQKSVMSAFNYGFAANQAQMLKIDQLHNQGYSGSGIIIGVMDGGFNSVDQMDVFDSLFINNQILGTRDFVEPGNNLFNTSISSHGTMVLSTMGGNLPGQIVGTAPHASYYLFRTEDTTDEYLMEEYYWVQAAEYADSLGVDVLNTSLGYTVFENPAENHSYEDMDGNTTPITIAADLAAAKGMLVVNSAGNHGNSSWMYISAPADGDSVLTVGAVNPSGNYATFSSRGPTSDGRIKPDVMAQGDDAVVAAPQGIYIGDGTSFSSPILCGAAACLWQANPTYSNMDIYNAIKNSASMASNPDNFNGWGIPDFMIAHSLLVGQINLPNNSDEITSYPNPFTDFIIVQFNIDTPNIVEMALFNTQGYIVRKSKIYDLKQGHNQVRINDLGMLPKGVYLLQLTDGKKKFSGKIIK